MEYFQEVLDRSTGKLVKVSRGDWITITELGELMGAGKRDVRAVLREMGFLVIENDRHRLAPWVVERGWGHRINRRGCYPFDTIGPEARGWVEERWAEATATVWSLSAKAEAARDHLTAFLSRRRNPDMRPQEQVCWLCDFYPDLSQSEKASIIGISQQLVSRFEEVRRRHLQRRFTVREREALGSVQPEGQP